MLYKNKNIRQLYSFYLGLLVVGTAMAIIGLILLIIGFAVEKIHDMQQIERILGGVLALVGLIMIAGNVYALMCSRKVFSLSEITADDIEKAAESEGSIWLEHTRIYITPDMLVGFTSDIGNFRFEQTAFKYEDIKRLYGYNKVSKENIQQINNNKNRFQIMVEVSDGNKYLISDVLSTGYDRKYYIMELKLICDELKSRATWIESVPENVKYRTFRFAYCLRNEEDEQIEISSLDEASKYEICRDFDEKNIAFNYAEGSAIVSLEMKFIEEGNVEITAGYFGDREQDINDTLYEFLKNQLKTGLGEGLKYGDIYVDFID